MNHITYIDGQPYLLVKPETFLLNSSLIKDVIDSGRQLCVNLNTGTLTVQRLSKKGTRVVGFGYVSKDGIDSFYEVSKSLEATLLKIHSIVNLPDFVKGYVTFIDSNNVARQYSFTRKTSLVNLSKRLTANW